MPNSSASEEKIPFRIHPRVFAALGEDLVTNDTVAVIELVKNSYDALATRVDVAFGKSGAQNGHYLEILDNGTGMTRKVLEEAWCVVATPFRRDNPTAGTGDQIRQVSGNKGLGRLSAARLGSRLEMLTKAAGEPCWMVEVEWSDLSKANALDNCFASCRRFIGALPFDKTGTRVRVLGLHSDWDSGQIADLDENLARLLSPFSKVDDFRIYLTAPDSEQRPRRAEVTAPEFLSHPPYAIRGHVTEDGEVKARYEFDPVSDGHPREHPITLSWSDIRKNSEIARKLKPAKPDCGPFTFEIRAWDISADDTRWLAERYQIAKGNVRKAIRAHKGISVYRDRILVLPKSDERRDWLGLDLRRVSRVGTRLSTSQIVGYVAISMAQNPLIEDTSDREDLARNSAVLAFEEILKASVSELEALRDEDRLKPSDQVKLQNLLEDVSANDLVQDVSALVEDGSTTREALVRVQDFSARLEVVREALKKRLVYYSRLATIGTIAQMLVHEIRNRTTAIGRFLRFAGKDDCVSANRVLADQLSLAESSVSALEKLADTFAPLASRGFRRGRRDSTTEESISRCLSLLDGDIRRGGIAVVHSRAGQTRVSVDPGELDTILINLLTNSLYWVSRGTGAPQIEIGVRRIQNGQRARITVSDSGPGVAEDDAEKIFLPGVTRKPGGIGMGLTIAAELVSDYGGRLSLEQPGKLGGASFAFDVPTKA
jgi:signal transduction histidine kinase